ncbi:hypothetical protein OAT16_11525 [Prolixibacteraceae bacterium]|nr:hypothetical protein [Prolixibacteraceae bacterium]
MSINFLDKVKFEINKKDPYQYFYQYWHYDIKLDGKKLEKALLKIYKLYHKLNTKLIFHEDKYTYKKHDFTTIYHEIENSDNDHETYLHLFLSKQVNNYISNSDEAPIILIHIISNSTSTLLFLHNHIYYDGHSATKLTEQFWSLTEKKEVIKMPENISDNEILDHLNVSNILTKLTFPFYLSKHILRSQRFTSKNKKVYKLYTKSSSKINYHSFFIEKRHLSNDNNIYSTNTKLVALIADQLIQMKGAQTNQQCIISIPQNIRDSKLDILGNAVNGISIHLSQQMSIEQKKEEIHKTVERYKTRSYIKAAYLLSTLLTKNKKNKKLLSPFKNLSKNHHCYISNHGKSEILLQNPNLKANGSFNYPLQEHYGLIFTITYNVKQVCLGIASSEQFFSKQDLLHFEKGFKQKLKS